MRLVDHALAVHRGGDRRAERLGQRGHLGLRVDRPATGDDHRLGGGGEQRRGPADVARVGVRRCHRRADPRLAGPGLLQHVDRNLDVHRSGTASGEGAERLGHRRGRLVGTAHPAAPAHQLVHCAAGVFGLVQLAEVAAFGAGGQAGREQEHRLRFAIGGRGCRHRVGQGGSAGGDHDTGPSADPRIGLGRIAGALFVAGRDRPDTGLAEVPVELQVVRAGDAEDGVDAMRGKGFDDGGAAVAVLTHGLAASTDISSYATCAAAIPVISAWS